MADDVVQMFDAESSTFTYLLIDPVSREAVLIDPVDHQAERDLELPGARFPLTPARSSRQSGPRRRTAR